MKLKMIACSQMSSMDAGTGFVSLFNIIEDLNVASFPVLLQNFCVFFFLEKEDGDAERPDFLLIFNCGGIKIAEFPVQSDFAGKLGNKTLINLKNLVIPTPGRLEVILMHEANRFGEYCVNINVIGGISAASTHTTGVTPDAPAPQQQS